METMVLISSSRARIELELVKSKQVAQAVLLTSAPVVRALIRRLERRPLLGRLTLNSRWGAPQLQADHARRGVLGCQPVQVLTIGR